MTWDLRRGLDQWCVVLGQGVVDGFGGVILERSGSRRNWLFIDVLHLWDLSRSNPTLIRPLLLPSSLFPLPLLSPPGTLYLLPFHIPHPLSSHISSALRPLQHPFPTSPHNPTINMKDLDANKVWTCGGWNPELICSSNQRHLSLAKKHHRLVSSFHAQMRNVTY